MENQNKEEYILNMFDSIRMCLEYYRMGIIKRWKFKEILKENGFTKDDYLIKEIKKIDKQLRINRNYQNQKITI